MPHKDNETKKPRKLRRKMYYIKGIDLVDILLFVFEVVVVLAVLVGILSGIFLTQGS